MELSNAIYFVTSKGSVKGPRGLLHPGDVFPIETLRSGQLEKLIEGGTLCADRAVALSVEEPNTQPPLPMNDAGTEDETSPPARAASQDDSVQRQALREAQRADQEAVEVLGSGPVRVDNKEILPETKTDPSNVTLADLAGQHISVEDYNSLKN